MKNKSSWQVNSACETSVIFIKWSTDKHNIAWIFNSPFLFSVLNSIYGFTIILPQKDACKSELSYLLKDIVKDDGANHLF